MADLAPSLAGRDHAVDLLPMMHAVPELRRQLRHAIDLGIPALIGRAPGELEGPVLELERRISLPGAGLSTADARIPVVLVLPGIPPEKLMPCTRQGEREGYVDMRPVQPREFTPIDGIAVPATPYLLLDVDTGRDTLGIRPRDALQLIRNAGRSPLTLEEGVMVLAAFPGVLRDRNCFQMLGSRRAQALVDAAPADKRIASLWVTSEGRPRLGWCYEGVPHSWLGAASCAARLS